MRRLFEGVRRRLEDFVEQRDDVLLVVGCEDGAASLILKTLQEIDEADASDLFWLFADEAKRAPDWVGTLVERFEERHRMVCEGLEKNGRPRWPALPAAVRRAGSAAARLRALLEFSRSLLPPGPEFRVVWGLMPLKIADAPGLAALFEELLRPDGPSPWYHHMRLIVREDSAQRVLRERLAKTPRVAWYEPDLSVGAQEKSVEEEVTDPGLPASQRMQSLFLLAGMDYAHRRFPDALKKYGVLLDYYKGMGNQTMLALVLNGMGEVHQRAGDLSRAKAHFECALSPAILAESPPVLLNVTLNLGNLALAVKDWKEGETYFDGAEKLAAAQLNAPTKIHCLENRGVCQERLERPKEAAESWEAGAQLAKATEERDLQRRILERLRALYDRYGQKQKKAEVERELSLVQGGARAN